MAKKCHCFVRHAVTPDERKDAKENLRYSRSVGDIMGTLLALASLGQCPAKED